MEFEFIIPRRPVSFQTTDRNNLRLWKEFVYGYSFREWQNLPIINQYLRFSVVFLCDESPPDINNVIKPIEDALCGLVYPDDNCVMSVDGHTRFFNEPVDIDILPDILTNANFAGNECTYIKIRTINHEEIFI